MAMTDESTPFDILGAGAGGPLTPGSPWFQYSGWIQYPGGVVLGSPVGGNKGPGTINLLDIFINNVAFDTGTVLMLVGGTLTGPLILAADPSNNLGAATKQYVDTGVSTKVSKAGDTMTGALTLPADPT